MVFGIDGRPANADQRVGIGNFCDGLLRALLAISSDVSFRIYLDAEPREGLLGTHHAADLRVLPRRAAWTQLALATELRQDPPDAFLAPGLQVPLWRACPAVATVYDLAYRTFPGYFPWQQRVQGRAQAAVVLRNADHLLAASQSTKAEIERLYSVTGERVTVVHGGVSDRFSPDSSASGAELVRSRYGLPSRYILYVGVLQPRKNLVRLMEAFSHVCEGQPDLPHHLVIAGRSGWLYGPILEAARTCAAKDRIHLLGYVPDQDLPALMASADLLTLVSLWEGFGLPVAEAMACGTAVLASNTSSLPEVVGDAGILVDPYDTDGISHALKRVMMDDAFRKALEARGLEQAAGFTWRRSAEGVLRALTRVAEEGRTV